jgi:phospholipid/cholesterol/gamma-HCH transport system substrate-binding protein
MEPDQKFAAVGLFVVLSALGLVGFSLWLSGRLANQDKACYVMRFDNSVAGLSQGSTITFRGVGVGQVQSIRINPRNDAQILVRAALEQRTPIKPNTVAQLKPQGVTGASYIELDLGQGVTGSGQPLGHDDSCKVIVTLPSGIEQIVNMLPRILDQTLEVTQRLSDLLGQGNVQNVSETLANLNALTGEMRKVTAQVGPQLTSATTQLNAAMANLNKVTASINQGGGSLQDLQDTVRQARAAAEEVKTLAQDVRTNPRRILNAPVVKEEQVP